MNVSTRKTGRQFQGSASRANEVGESAEIHISTVFQFRNGVLSDIQALGKFSLRELLGFAQFRKRQFLEHGLSTRLASRPAFGRHFFLQFSEISRHIISPSTFHLARARWWPGVHRKSCRLLVLLVPFLVRLAVTQQKNRISLWVKRKQNTVGISSMLDA